EIIEDVLVHDLIYIFQGIHGRYIKFNPETDKFTIDEKIKIPKPTYELISKLSELGWLYRQIHQFTYQVQPIGLVRQRFCAALQNELTEYYKLITVLESQLITSGSSEEKNKNFVSNKLSLKRLLVWTQEPLQRIRFLETLVKLFKKCGGGDLISKIHNFVNHGDPFVQNFIHNLLCEVSTPFFDMLKKWIYEGELNDQYNEFFVEEHQDIHGEDLWNLKYSMRQNSSMLPSFINTTLAKKILVIGKSLNFIKDSCNDSEYVLSRSKEAENLNVFNYDSIEALEEIVDENYINTSNYLLDILFTRYKLKDHLNALKRYLLLGQGDFIQNLMDSLGPSLRNKAVGLYRHNLTGSLESAIRASNAQYDDSEILKHLDVRLLSPSEGDVGWDVFTLDYHVSQPLNTIITSSAMEKYRKLFHFLWRLKRVEHTLSSSWKRHSIRNLKNQEIRNELHKSNLILSEMIHFIYQLQYYFLFEVLECSWDELNKYIDKHTGNLDQLIKEHNRYLANIIQKGLLAPSEVNIIIIIFK
ncbi:Spc97/Spc98, partial [Anaeromyces robustus]